MLQNQVNTLLNTYHGLSKKNRNDVIEKYKIPIEEYIDRCENNIKLWNDLEKDMSPIYEQPLSRSNEYASYIVDGIVNGNEITINANIMNEGYIENLPGTPFYKNSNNGYKIDAAIYIYIYIYT